MKSFLKLFFLSLLSMAACKKENSGYQTLSISGISSVAFASGDVISIYGAGFDTIPDNNSVVFNGVAGEVAAATPNRLQVIAPLLVNNGNIVVRVHGMKATLAETFTIVNVLQGTYVDNLTLTADKKYLLRGNVVFQSKLIVEGGTVIYGEKLTHGSLTVSNVDFQGTADKPIVFTSDQAPGSRQPGDWGGISSASATDNQQQLIPLGIFDYVRVEYAGYHQLGKRAAAISLLMDPNSIFRYIQASYSSGDGIDIVQANNSSGGYIEHIVALGCGGDDFYFNTGGGLTAQYGLALKDPYYADVLKGNSITGGAVLSNFTVIGYNPSARNISSPAGVPLNKNAGSGIVASAGDFTIYNSVIAANWAAGVSVVSAGNPLYDRVWIGYEDSLGSPYSGEFFSFIHNNYFAGTAPAAPTHTGGTLGRYNYNALDGYEDVSGTAQLMLFGIYNDTTRLLDLIQGKDDLGLAGIADYQRMNHPSLLPPAGSPLLTGARFPTGSLVNTPQLNKSVTYIGAFGSQDWTLGWTNFNPQQTSY